MNRLMRTLSAFVVTLALTSCGGGGGNSGSSPFGGGGDGGGGGGGGVAVADLLLETSKATIANTGSDTVTVIATALDASRNAVAGATVQIGADADAVLSGTGATTDSSGKVTGTLSIGANKSNRVITVTVTAGSLTKSTTVSVFGAKLVGSPVPAVVAPGASGKVQFRLTDQANNPMASQDVTISATGLTPSTATGKTGTNGEFEFEYTAPGTSGSYTVNATAGGASADPAPTIQVQAANAVPPVTATITSASVSANPSVVGINLAGNNNNRSEIRALFLGANNQPIRNVRVQFDLDGDANSVGGAFSSGTSTLYSDVNGVVTTAYIPAARSSPTNGVTIRACYGLSETDPNLLNCTTNSKVTLTISQEPLGVSIGTNELIIVNELTYAKKFIVSVADSAGNALQDVNLVVSLDLLNFRKGRYDVAGDAWQKTTDHVCANEDVNRNGVLEVGEDLDNDNRLEPGKSDVTVSLLQTKTRQDGTAELQILYAKSFGSWVDAKITVSASGIAGTEGRASWLLVPIPVDAASLKNKDVPPAYRVSPYGQVADCTDPN